MGGDDAWKWLLKENTRLTCLKKNTVPIERNNNTINNFRIIENWPLLRLATRNRTALMNLVLNLTFAQYIASAGISRCDPLILRDKIIKQECTSIYQYYWISPMKSIKVRNFMLYSFKYAGTLNVIHVKHMWSVVS